MLFECFDFGKIKGGETGIEMKLQLEAIASLTIGKAGKLLGVAKQKFNLKTQRVELVDFRWVLLHIRREQDDKSRLFGVAAVEQVGQSNRALERDVEHDRRVQFDIGLDTLDKRQPVLSGHLDLAVVLAPSAARFLLACVEPAQIRVTTQLADHMQLKMHGSCDEVLLGMGVIKSGSRARGN